MTAALRTVAHHDLRVDVRRGDGTGTPLVLCSGIGAGYEMFEPLVDALDPGLEIIRFDPPGVGGSPASKLPLGFPQLAWILDRLLDGLGYEQVDVLGYSWGGALAQQFAAQHSSRCRRLVLISTSTGLLSVPGDVDALASLVIPPRSAGKTARALDAVFGRPAGTGNGLRSELPGMLLGALRSGTSLGFLHQLSAVAIWTSLPFLPGLRQPVLVMGGDSDPIAPPANAQLMAALIRTSTLRIFPGGHFEIITAAASLAPTISQFLAADR